MAMGQHWFVSCNKDTTPSQASITRRANDLVTLSIRGRQHFQTAAR